MSQPAKPYLRPLPNEVEFWHTEELTVSDVSTNWFVRSRTILQIDLRPTSETCPLSEFPIDYSELIGATDPRLAIPKKSTEEAPATPTGKWVAVNRATGGVVAEGENAGQALSRARAAGIRSPRLEFISSSPEAVHIGL